MSAGEPAAREDAAGAGAGRGQPEPQRGVNYQIRQAFERLGAGILPKVRSSVGGERFDRFTVLAKGALAQTQKEARSFNHNYIGTEHLLLALVTGEGVAGKVLADLGIEADSVRDAIVRVIGMGKEPAQGDIGLTPRTKKVIELAVQEAKRLGHNYVGTEHLLLGLVREGEGIGAGVLERLGASLERVRRKVLEVTASDSHIPESMGTKDSVLTCRVAAEDLTAIDMLVEAGIRSTRSDAAQWLIHAGIEANKALFEHVESTVGEIRRLREQARRMAWEVAGGAGAALDEAVEETPPAKG